MSLEDAISVGLVVVLLIAIIGLIIIGFVATWRSRHHDS